MAATASESLHDDKHSTQQPQGVDPAAAQAAQIPLQAFTIPPFPQEARHLRALTLTSDIKLDEYQGLLDKPWSIPSAATNTTPISIICPNIKSLTLELFALGYPPGFLSTLAHDVAPHTKELVVYSQLLDGISEESRTDAAGFFQSLPELRSLHLLDTFVRAGTWARIAPHLRSSKSSLSVSDTERVDEKAPSSDTANEIAISDATKSGGKRKQGLLALEVNYTTRTTDDSFLSSIHAHELPTLITPDLISLSLNISPPETTNDPDDPANLPVEKDDAQHSEEEKRKREMQAEGDGVLVFNATQSTSLIEALTGEERPKSLKLLNLTLYTLTLDGLRKLLELHKELVVLSVTLQVEKTEGLHAEVMKLLMESGKSLEQVEITIAPGLAFHMAINKVPSTALADAFPASEQWKELNEKGSALESLGVNVLKSRRLQSLKWEKRGQDWVGGQVDGQS